MAERDSEDPTETNMTTAPAASPSLTTQQLQKNLKVSKQRERPITLLFEIPSAHTHQDALSKYVLYSIVLIRSGSFDCQRVSVERRYSDFYRLHTQLLTESREEMEEVMLPRKHLTRNFTKEVVTERRLGLQDYLASLFSLPSIRHSPSFSSFFTFSELKTSHCLLRAGQFSPAVSLLENVLQIQEKLLPWQKPTLTVPTLCALAVCYRDMEEPEKAFNVAQKALPIVRRYGGVRQRRGGVLEQQRAGLLEMLVEVGYELARPVATVQEELSVLRDRERGEVNTASLKEMVVKQFI